MISSEPRLKVLVEFVTYARTMPCSRPACSSLITSASGLDGRMLGGAGLSAATGASNGAAALDAGGEIPSRVWPGAGEFVSADAANVDSAGPAEAGCCGIREAS